MRHNWGVIEMAIGKTTKRVELALIELEYLAADILFDSEGQSNEENARRVAYYYQAACKALEVCLEVIEQAKEQPNKTLVG